MTNKPYIGTRFFINKKYNTKVYISYGINFDLFLKHLKSELLIYNYNVENDKFNEGFNDKISRNAPGTCFDMRIKEDGLYYHWIYSIDHPGVLVHEITHIVHQILINNNIDYYASLEKQEEFAYMTQEIFNLCFIAPTKEYIIK